MSKLTLPILCAFLPHKVQVQGRYNNQITLRYRHFTNDYGDFIGIDQEAKLLLRPLSSLTIPITHNGETFVPIERLTSSGKDVVVSHYTSDGNITETITLTYKMMGETYTDFLINRNTVDCTDYHYVQKLIEWHFDVFGGIEAGWALPIDDNEN